jgi:hypothetical protein
MLIILETPASLPMPNGKLSISIDGLDGVSGFDSVTVSDLAAILRYGFHVTTDTRY